MWFVPSQGDKGLSLTMVVVQGIILFAVFALTGCALATGSRNSAPSISSYSAASISLPRIGGSAAGDHASISVASVVGPGSFPRSFLIPGTDTSIRIGG
jgi:hypothetical protein